MIVAAFSFLRFSMYRLEVYDIRLRTVSSARVPSSVPLLLRGRTNPKSTPMSRRPTTASFTSRQGQYLAFIYAYTHVLGRPPAEADMQRHFGVSPPSVHQMVLNLERAGLVRRQPRVARSIEVLVAPELLPVLR
jgi:LexA DNA binding domain-containing protein